MVFDKYGNMTSCLWSDLFRRMLGYESREDFPDELSSWTRLLHPADREKTMDSFWTAVNDHSGKTKYSVRYRSPVKTGGYRWFAADGSLTRGLFRAGGPAGGDIYRNALQLSGWDPKGAAAV